MANKNIRRKTKDMDVQDEDKRKNKFEICASNLAT